MLKEELKKLETPCYIINSLQFEKNCSEVEKAFGEEWGENIIYGYSIKTNHHPFFLNEARERGWWAEAVSENEYEMAKKLGFERKNIIYNGPIKGEDLKEALLNGSVVNIDNFEEILRIRSYGFSSGIMVGLRVNFDLERYCAGETTAGIHTNRFGFCLENGDLKKAIDILKEKNVMISGLHMHVSTKTRSISVFKKIAEIVCEIKNEYNLQLRYIDIGGGFFGGQIVQGKPTMREYAKTICGILSREFDPLQTAIIIEPGASITATAVSYLTKVNSIRKIRDEVIVTVDGTSLHINPFMAKRMPKYEIMGYTTEKVKIQQICGNTCMETDRFACLENANMISKDAIIIFYDAGAYTMCLNNYFINDFPNVYVCKNDRYILCGY